MGGQQSTQRISIDNEGDPDPSSVIQVSESVADRIKGGSDSQQEKEEEKPPALGAIVSTPGLSSFRHVPITGNIPIQGLPYITSKDIQQELEKEIDRNNKYWEKRIADLQKTHIRMNKIMEEEYIKATEELNNIMPRIPNRDGKLPCQRGKTVVAKCYKENSRQPLHCAAEVEQFTSCMNNTRIKLQEEGKLN